MDIWKHSLLSQKKFGGKADDYYAVHKFMDSSKFFYHHAKHRLLLHHLLGIEWAIMACGDLIENADGKKVLVRDIAAEHCKEDLSGVVPTLSDWLAVLPNDFAEGFEVPDVSDFPELEAFVLKPYWRTGLKSALFISCSDFGIHLIEQCLGLEAAKILANRLLNPLKVKTVLASFKFHERWQYTPDQKALEWLASEGH
jgi:hypothetical protein